MGNGQSAEAPRRPQNKLSKPRTNNHSSTSLLVTKSGPPSRRNSELNDGNAKRYSLTSGGAVVGEAGKGEESTKKKRMSMFRSKSVQPHSAPLQINSGVDIEFLDRNGSAGRWTRRASFHESPEESRPPARPARMSLQHTPYSQHHARLSLVAEAPSPQPDQEPQMETSKRRSTYIKEEESPQLANALPARTNSETDLYTPMRRRSLLQHGIATRKSWIENDPPKSSPSQMTSQDDLQNYYYNPSKPTSSPLSDLVALGRLEGNSPGPRTMTPNDLDYGHIGAFKLGSLRITNGAASPAPSLEGRPATREGEYSERDGRGSANSHRSGLGQRSHTISVPQESIRPPWVIRAESPLRHMLTEPESEPEPKPEPKSLTVNTHLTLPEFSAFNFDTDSPTKSLDLAHEYMQDLALSPFSFDSSPPLTPMLQTTSKHMAVEDDLFEPEPGTPEIMEARPPRSFDSGYPAEETVEIERAEKCSRDLAPMGLTKADSGYSSNVSLRSFKGKAPTVPAKEAPPTPPKEPASRVASSAYSFQSTASEVTVRSKRSLPALPREEIPPQPFREAPPVPLKHSSVHNSGVTIPAPPLPSKSSEQVWAAASSRAHVVVAPKHLRKKSLPSMAQPVKEEYAQRPLDSTTSLDPSTASLWRKDKKQRPQSMQPQQPVFTVQAMHSTPEELSVPPVPPHVSRHLEERVDGFPVTCFPNTFSKTNHLRKSVSRETLGTIFSVGSAEWREEASFARLQSALPPVPVEATIPENPSPSPTPEVNRRNTYQPSSAAPQYVADKNHQYLQAIPRKEASPIQQKMRQDFENHITSYENVSSSTGKSPYDIALGPIAKRPTAQERAKSMTSQLEAEAAERFARARSVSQESDSTIIRRISYESISNANPFSTPYNKARERPPPAHAKYTGIGSGNPRPTSMLLSRRSSPNLVNGEGQIEEKRLSLRSQLSRERVKSPPPISMQTQRKMIPTQIGSHVIIPPSRTPPIPPQEEPNRSAPQPPVRFSPPLRQEEPDPWAKQSNYWLESRKGSGETLQQGINRPKSARPSFDHQRPQLMKTHSSWDTSQQHWDSYDGQYENGSYHHTYGSYEHNKENWENQNAHYAYQYSSDEYYDNAPHREYDDQRHEQIIHQHQASKASMLVLDRDVGGVGYGYGAGGGAGTRNTGTRNVGRMDAGGRKGIDVRLSYGLDFSDVPVFSQGVKVEA